MLSIVAAHSWFVFGSTNSKFDIAVVTPFKFATIGFFLISGFLLGERVDRRNPVEYFMRRFKRIFLPWSLWFGIFCAALSIHQLADPGRGPGSLGQRLWTVFSTSRSALYDTSFWFVPNLLVCMAVLLMCRRYLYTLKLGFALLAVNLVYVANIYEQWFPPAHTHALFGFVFYLWLGSYAAQNFERVGKVLARVPAAAFVAMSIVTGIASYAESHMLAAANHQDALNTLRPSNQVFSVCVVLMIFKFSRATWPQFIDVRRDTFGLYLTHTLVLRPILHLLKHFPESTPTYARNAEGVLLWVAVSVGVYFSCLAITLWLASRPSLQWMVGQASQNQRPTLGAFAHPIGLGTMNVAAASETRR